MKNLRGNIYVRKNIVYLLLVVCITVSAQAQTKISRSDIVFIKDEETNKLEKIKLYEGSYALVIGVSDYTNDWSDLLGVNSV